MSAHRPKGYLGKNHETIGSDILAVVHSLQRLVGEDVAIPRHIVSPDELKRLSAIDPNGWYPIAQLLELMERLDAKLGRYALIKMGRVLFEITHAARLRKDNVLTQGRDVIYGIDEMYRHANRGEHIGGWRVLSFDAHGAELEKTTPHHCAVEEGILSEALATAGAPAMVAHRACAREGAEACVFVITPAVVGGRWQ